MAPASERAPVAFDGGDMTRPAASSPPPTELQVVDLVHLGGFTEGDAELESELGVLYLSSAEVYLQRLRAAFDDREAWANAAHALKGASSNLGARRVAACALEAEHAGPDASALAALEAAVADVRVFFEQRLSLDPAVCPADSW